MFDDKISISKVNMTTPHMQAEQSCADLKLTIRVAPNRLINRTDKQTNKQQTSFQKTEWRRPKVFYPIQTMSLLKRESQK